MTRDEYDALKSAAKADYNKTIAAIERVWQLSQQLSFAGDVRPQVVVPRLRKIETLKPIGLTPVPLDQSAPIDSRSRGLSDRIRDALRTLPVQFTIVDVLSSLGDDTINRTSVATALRRMSEEENPPVMVVQSGAGKRPSVYEWSSDVLEDSKPSHGGDEA